MARPTITVEAAFGAAFDVLSPTWTDITSYVDWSETMEITRGRSSEKTQADANRLRLTLKNSDGRFTPEYASSPYYPNVVKGTPIRVRATWNSVTYDRFRGYVDEWPVVWPGDASFDSTVTVNATSLIGRLGRSATFRSIVEEEVLYDDPYAYWPLGEPADSTEAADITGTADPLRVYQLGGSGGTLEFGSGTGPGTDSLSSPLFTHASSTDGKCLLADTIDLTTDGNGLTVELAFTADPDADARALFEIWKPEATYDNLDIGLWGTLKADGTLELVGSMQDGFGISTLTLTTSTTFDDGLVHYVAFAVELFGTDRFQLRMSWDGTTTFASGSTPFGVPPTSLTRFTVGAHTAPGKNRNLFTGGSIAHVAIHDTSLTTEKRVRHGQAMKNGFDPEISGNRILRYARLAGIVNLMGSISETGGIVRHIDTTGKTALELMRLCEATEHGVLWDTPAGLLTMAFREERYNLASSCTLSAANQQVGGLEPVMDDFGMANDVTVSAPDIGDQRWYDAASVATFGPYNESIETIAATNLAASATSRCLALAQWIVDLHAQPRLRFSRAVVDVLSETDTAQATLLMQISPNDKITLSDLPSQAPSSSIDVFVEGLTETIRFDEWTIALNLSPDIGVVWELDDTTYSVLGTTTRLAL